MSNSTQRNNQINLGGIFEQKFGFGAESETQVFDVGTPHLRTNWIVESVSLEAISFSFVFKKSSKGSELQETIRLLYDSTPVAFTAIKGKVVTEGEPVTVTLPHKVVILELFTPVTVRGGHSLSIELELAGKKPPEFGSRSFIMNNPKLLVQYQQVF